MEHIYSELHPQILDPDFILHYKDFLTLPVASCEHYMKLAKISVNQADQLYICLKSGDNYVWKLLVEAGQPLPTLAAPVITLAGSIVSWTAVPNATTYKIFVNDVQAANTSSTSCSLTSIITIPGTYTIKVKASAASGYFDSDYSNSVSYTLLPEIKAYYGFAPDVTRVQYKELTDTQLKNYSSPFTNTGNTISWHPLSGAGVIFIMLKDGVPPLGGSLISGGLTTVFSASDITTEWNCSGVNGHADITIDGKIFHVYGLRLTTWNATDTINVNI